MDSTFCSQCTSWQELFSVQDKTFTSQGLQNPVVKLWLQSRTWNCHPSPCWHGWYYLKGAKALKCFLDSHQIKEDSLHDPLRAESIKGIYAAAFYFFLLKTPSHSHISKWLWCRRIKELHSNLWTWKRQIVTHAVTVRCPPEVLISSQNILFSMCCHRF